MPDPRRQAPAVQTGSKAPDSLDSPAAGPPVPAPAASRTSLIPSDPTRDLAGALHEVSNALTVVIGWIERARGASPEEVTRALDVAADRASQARAIVRRAIGAEVHAEPPAPVSAVVADAITGLEPELRRANIRAVAHVLEAVQARTIDHAPTVLQILTNLLLNAIALSPAGSTVHVEAMGVDGGAGLDGGDPHTPGAAAGFDDLGPARVIFAVTDEGPGIPPERRATLFQANLSTRAGGAGIGLRHAAALAQSLGGTLALGPPGRPHEGARFELFWPLASLPTPLRPPPDSGEQPLARPQRLERLESAHGRGSSPSLPIVERSPDPCPSRGRASSWSRTTTRWSTCSTRR